VCDNFCPIWWLFVPFTFCLILMFSIYTACVCASFYDTFHDHITNSSFWCSFCPFTFCLTCLYCSCSPLFPYHIVMQWVLLVDFSFERLLQSMQTHYGAQTHSHGGGGEEEEESAEADHSLPSTAKVITSTGMHMDSFTLRLCMPHFVHTYHFPHTLYNYITFFWKITPGFNCMLGMH
jgi:hypothetical protein